MTISDAIRYVGVNDTDIDLFESQYPVPHGVSYNSYLLLDDKIALLDTVDKRKYDDWVAKVDAVLDGRTPDYIVVHHLEPDHAGSLQMTIEKYPGATLVLSAKALAMLPQFFDLAGRHQGAVGERGRHAGAGSPYLDLCDGTHGALAGGDGQLRTNGKGTL